MLTGNNPTGAAAERACSVRGRGSRVRGACAGVRVLEDPSSSRGAGLVSATASLQVLLRGED